MRLSFLALAIAILGTSGSLEAAKSASDGIHRVRKGETAAKIAQAHGLSVTQLAALNPKVRLAKLSLGMSLKVAESHKTAKAVKVIKTVPESRKTEVEETAPATAVGSLPATPGIGPALFGHLEAMLPTVPRLVAPDGTAADPRPNDLVPGTPSGLAARIQPVLPPASPDLAPLSTVFEPADPSKLDLLWPVETRSISSAWGPRIRSKVVRVKRAHRKRSLKVSYRGSHKGVDLAAPMGASVFAAMDGRVTASGKVAKYGNYVVIDHGNGVATLYAHHRANLVHEGDIVHRGQKIAEVGMTGNATGPHLHFELRIGGLPQNPLPVLNDVEEIPAEMMAQNEALSSSGARR